MLVKLYNLLPINQEVLFVCIGTDRSTGDALGPLVGTRLEAEGYNVLGTLKDPVHAVNIDETIQSMNERYPNHFVVAIDACLGRVKSVGKINVHKGAVKPGAGVNKDLPEVGDVAITGVVNVSGFMEFFVLQNTRLSLVMDMANEIALSCMEAMVMKEARDGYNMITESREKP